MSTVNLTIDGKPIAVAPGTTILSAARTDFSASSYRPKVAYATARLECMAEEPPSR